MVSLGKYLNSAVKMSLSLFRPEAFRCPKYCNRCHIRLYSGAYEGEGKTYAVVLNKEFSGLMINGFSPVGFKLNNGLSVYGPIAIFPRTIVSWDTASASQICEEALCLFWLLEPKIDILVIGVGGKEEPTSPVLIRLLDIVRRHKIQIEVLPTESACATFNFLNAEGRFVGGALLPPKYLTPSETDVSSIPNKNVGLPKGWKLE